jgi:hypothetical protein
MSKAETARLIALNPTFVADQARSSANRLNWFATRRSTEWHLLFTSVPNALEHPCFSGKKITETATLGFEPRSADISLLPLYQLSYVAFTPLGLDVIFDNFENYIS